MNVFMMSILTSDKDGNEVWKYLCAQDSEKYILKTSTLGAALFTSYGEALAMKEHLFADTKQVVRIQRISKAEDVLKVSVEEKAQCVKLSLK